MKEINWNNLARNYLKRELAKKHISHGDLVGYLDAIGVKETKAGIDSKISRGTFSASFLLQCLAAIGCETMEISVTNKCILQSEQKIKNQADGENGYEDLRSRIRYVNVDNFIPRSRIEPTVISLFSGAGGIDIGLEQAGFKTLVCVDNDLDCRVTLKHNRPDWFIFDSTERLVNNRVQKREAGNIRQIEPEELLKAANRGRGEITLIVGGAPCQPYSNIGKKYGKHDEKNGDLFLEFVRMVRGIESQAFIFENVAGITQKRHSQVIQYMTEQFRGMNYGISHTILNAANYGVSQCRERFFLVGIKGIENPAFPLPTHFRDEASWKTFTRYFDVKPKSYSQPWISIKQIFKTLPKKYKHRKDYAVMNISQVVKDRMKYISQGENFKVLPLDMRPNCWKSGKHLGSDTFGRLVEDMPSVTIRTAAYNPSKGRYIHPKEDRGLNTIEMATIQGFPYEWEFKSFGRERVTLVSAGKQIGNAVPPPLAKALGKAILTQIQQNPSQVREFSEKQCTLAVQY